MYVLILEENSYFNLYVELSFYITFLLFAIVLSTLN